VLERRQGRKGREEEEVEEEIKREGGGGRGRREGKKKGYEEAKGDKERTLESSKSLQQHKTS